MGLDSIWKMPDGVNHPAFEPALDLCGGLFSGFGQGSFRGKVYNEFIEHVSASACIRKRCRTVMSCGSRMPSRSTTQQIWIWRL
jgi:hypothetical protein